MAVAANNDLLAFASQLFRISSACDYNSVSLSFAVLEDDVDKLDRLLRLSDAEIDVNHRPHLFDSRIVRTPNRPLNERQRHVIRIWRLMAQVEPPQTPLLYACTLNRTECADRLLDDARVRIDNVLLFAIVQRSLDVLDLLLHRHDRVPVPSLITNKEGNALLISTAAQFGFDDIVARLLNDRRFDARELARDDYLLYRWYSKGHVLVVRQLLLRVRLVELCLALRALHLPTYVVLEIVDWLPLMFVVVERQEKVRVLRNILERNNGLLGAQEKTNENKLKAAKSKE